MFHFHRHGRHDRRHARHELGPWERPGRGGRRGGGRVLDHGDLRLLTLNGRPLVVDGQYACFRRYNDSGDARSNITAGGKVEMAVPDADALRIAEIIAPKLMQDGMYLAGLDIVGDKMMEINVDTPGGINMAEELTGADFSGHIVNDLERKVELRDLYKRTLSNTELAMM